MRLLWQDLRFAIRTLKRGWLVTSMAVLSLALAIGGNATVFSMVDAFIFRPQPFPEPERMILAGERLKTQPPLQGSLGTSLAAFGDLAERSRTVDRWAAFRPRPAGLRGPDRSEAISAVEVTADYFGLLEVTPSRGRLFQSEEMVEGGPKVALVSQQFRVDRYGEDEDPLGDVIILNGEPHEVIGVVESDAAFLTGRTDVWLPLTRSPNSAPRDQRTYFTVGRMAPDASMEQVRSELTSILAQLEVEYPETSREWTADVYNVRNDIPTPQTRTLFLLLQGSVLAVLVIACVNIANLLLARWQTRTREVALRIALGAGRWRIVRQLLTESSVLVLAGGVLGIALGAVGIRLLLGQLAAVLPPGFEIVMNQRVVLFSLGAAVLAGLGAGLAPALQTLRGSHVAALKEGGGRAGGGRSRKSVSRILVVGEIALSFVALGGGSVMVQSFLQLKNADPGFEAEQLLTAVVRIPESRFASDDDRLLFLDQVLENAGRVPGVVSTAMASTLPQSPFTPSDSFRVLGDAIDPGATAPRAVIVTASPRYLETLGVELLQGRSFEDADRSGRTPVVMVNRSLAEAHFSERSAVGEWVTVDSITRQIVGVVEDVQQSLITVGPNTTSETIYQPLGQNATGATALVVLTTGEPTSVAQPVREALEGLDRDLTVSSVRTMEERVDRFFVGVDVFNTVLGGFGALALLLAALGTYGVLAYQVTQRSHEIGIRMAVGARTREVVGLIARQGIWLGVIGLAIGSLLTLPLVGTIRSLLSTFAEVDISTLGVIAAVLFGVTTIASVLPAMRAASVDPALTLREE